MSSSKPADANAMTESESSLMFTIFRRVQNIEKQRGVKIPDELKVFVNCSDALRQQGKCLKE